MSPHPLRGVSRLARIVLASIVISACVTINVYFPAAAAEKAADQIIDAVTGAAGSGALRPAPAPAAPPTGGQYRQDDNLLVVALGKLLHAIVPAAEAQEAANLDISSPEIRAITASMNARFGQLRGELLEHVDHVVPHLQGGVHTGSLARATKSRESSSTVSRSPTWASSGGRPLRSANRGETSGSAGLPSLPR